MKAVPVVEFPAKPKKSPLVPADSRSNPLVK
jgi:hypothetical protein